MFWIERLTGIQFGLLGTIIDLALVAWGASVLFTSRDR